MSRVLSGWTHPAAAAADHQNANQCSCAKVPAKLSQWLLLASIVAITALLAVYLCHQMCANGREGFVSKRALDVYEKSMSVFTEGGGNPKYLEYKKRVPGADPVQYNDIKQLFRSGNLTPANVEKHIV